MALSIRKPLAQRLRRRKFNKICRFFLRKGSLCIVQLRLQRPRRCQFFQTHNFLIRQLLGQITNPGLQLCHTGRSRFPRIRFLG